MAATSEPWDRSLSELVAADRTAKAADLRLALRVRAAQRAGHSWEAIGVALGITADEARRRFAPD